MTDQQASIVVFTVIAGAFAIALFCLWPSVNRCKPPKRDKPLSIPVARPVVEGSNGVSATAVSERAVAHPAEPRVQEMKVLDPPDPVDRCRQWNAEVFARDRAGFLLSQFQPIRRVVSEGIPSWFCPKLVIHSRCPEITYTADSSVELVVLQPIETDENDPDDGVRVFLLPLSFDLFQVLQVPVSCRDVDYGELSWRDVRMLLQQGYRSVGRDDLVDYGKDVPVQFWSERRRLRWHRRLYFSVVIDPSEAVNVARYASGRVLAHVRALRPRGAVKITCMRRSVLEPELVCLTFVQRYGTQVVAERRIHGRILSFDEETRMPPKRSAIVDFTLEGEVLNVFSPIPPETVQEKMTPSEARGFRIIERRRFAGFLKRNQ